MKKIAILFLVVIITHSCNKNREICCAIDTRPDDTWYIFSVVNEAGEDLLNENTENTLNNVYNIKIYNLIDGKEEQIRYHGYAIYRGITSEKDTLNFMRTNFTIPSDPALLTYIGIIEWSPNDRDTIHLEMTPRKSKSYHRDLSKITYNNKVVRDFNNSSIGKYFQIIK